jgi:hypothetical protein
MSSELPVTGDLVAAAQSGDRRAALEALRDELARALADASVGVKAQIASQLRATLKDIADLPVAGKVTPADEFRRRREARLAAAVPAASSGTEGNQ